MVDMGQYFVLLVFQGRSDHDEYHGACASGLLEDLLHVRGQSHLVPRPDRRDELDVLAGVETAASEARHVLEKMPPVAKRHRERRRRDDPAVWPLLRRLLARVDRISLAERRAIPLDLIGLDLDRLGHFE